MDIPDNLKKRIDVVADYVGNTTNDWLLIKRQLLISFPNEGRKLFSARHPCTKKQILNAFDKSVMSYWREITGVEPILDPAKIHDENWVHKKKGWALSLRKKIRNDNG